MTGQTRQHGPLFVHQFPCLSDNYGFLARCRETGRTAAIDTPDPEAIARAAEETGWGLDFVFNTHWHPDHVGGNEALKQRFGAQIVGPAGEGDKIPGRDRAVSGGDVVELGAAQARVIDTPGHTLGHIAYYVGEAGVAFVGDTLFSLGCGRLFEGTPAQMWDSLMTLRALPAETTIYCAHEYTKANAAFAVTVDPGNDALQARIREVERLRGAGEPTVPVRLGDEAAANPFLRADDARLAASVGMAGAAPEDVFGEVRRRKDVF